MRTRGCCVALLPLLLLAGCKTAAPAPPPADQSAQVIDAVKAADQAWEKAFAGRDTTAAVDAVEASGSVLAPNVPIATGSEAIRTLFAGFYALPGMTIDWEVKEVQASSSGDMAMTRGTYQLTFNDPKGKPVVDQGKYATVWRKQADGRWKVLLDAFNSDLPLPGS